MERRVEPFFFNDNYENLQVRLEILLAKSFFVVSSFEIKGIGNYYRFLGIV